MECSHVSFGLAGCVISFRNFPVGLIELGFNGVREFQLVFQEIINPRTDFFNLRAKALAGPLQFLEPYSWLSS